MRRWTWGFIQKYALGITGYPFSTSLVTQEPRTLDPLFYSFERLPIEVEDEHLAARQSDIGFNLMRLTNLLAEKEVTWMSVDPILKAIASDTRLVHAAYYMHPFCIDRVAHWIARPFEQLNKEASKYGYLLEWE